MPRYSLEATFKISKGDQSDSQSVNTFGFFDNAELAGLELERWTAEIIREHAANGYRAVLRNSKWRPVY